jgi:hypothetical protein
MSASQEGLCTVELLMTAFFYELSDSLFPIILPFGSIGCIACAVDKATLN